MILLLVILTILLKIVFNLNGLQALLALVVSWVVYGIYYRIKHPEEY